jgi:tRNA-splicing ligase RtcB
MSDMAVDTNSIDITAFGPVDERSRQQLANCVRASSESAPAVLCADHHPGYSMPIGGVLALKGSVIPAGVGYDIACGNCAVRTNIQAPDTHSDVSRLMDEIWRVISFGMGRNNDERIDEHPVYDAIANSPVVGQRKLLQSARNQLGTVGGGNHYVDLFEDRADGRLWVGVHFGSRGLGHKTCTGFLSLAAGKTFDEHTAEGGMDDPPMLLSLASPLGQDYLAAMQIAGEYAYAGRNWVVDRVLRILGATDTLRVHNHHNFAWKETHRGGSFIVIRKGATPAFPGQRGFIGGTMGDDAVIVEGLDSAQSASALYSTVHGAGRVMSRTRAAGKVKRKTVWACGQRDCNGELPIQSERGIDGSNPKCPTCGSKTHKHLKETKVRDGCVDWPNWQVKLKAQGVELRGAGADEAPECYKHLPDVLAYHGETIKILHTLRPIGVAMAGADVFDPYKD